MRTVHCPLCGLRYAHASELDVHVREDHCPEPEPERQDSIQVQRSGTAARGRPGRVLRLPW